MIKFKIFSDFFAPHKVDVIINEWLEQHPNVVIHDWKYQDSGGGARSICIMYTDKEEELNGDV